MAFSTLLALGDDVTPTCTSFLIGMTAIVATVILFKRAKGKEKDKKSPPFAPEGMLKTISRMNENGAFFFRDMVKASGSDIIRLRLPIPGGAYAVGDPTAMRAIFNDEATDKPKAIYSAFDFISEKETVFSRTNTKEWKSARKCIAYSFTSSEVKRMNRICTEQVESWIQKKLEPCIQKNETFDPSLEMISLTFRSILEAAFEYPYVTDEGFQDFMHHLIVSLKEFAGRHNGNPLRKYYGLFLSEFREAKKSTVAIRTFAAKILEAYRNNPNKSKNKTVIRMIVENKNYDSDKDRIADIIATFLAGFESTGYTLGTTLMLLAKYPDVAEKLRRELLSLEKSSSKSSRSGYLHNVIQESQRFIPAGAFGSARVLGRDFSFKDGSMVIPKGAICFLPMILAHHHKETFKDPENFRPERWDEEDEKMRAAFMSFAVGKRDCVGQSLAVTELYSVLPRLVTKYKFEIEAEGELHFFLTLKFVGARLKAKRFDELID